MKKQKKDIKKAAVLKYNPSSDEAPVLTAKGKGRIAEKLIETAARHGVPVQEDASLVEILSTIEVEQQIPPELYHLVAEILSFIYRADKRAADGNDAR